MINDKYIYLNIKDKSLSHVLDILTHMSFKDYGTINVNQLAKKVTDRSINVLVISLRDKTIRGGVFADNILKSICTSYEDFTEEYLKDPAYDLHTLIKKILHEIL